MEHPSHHGHRLDGRTHRDRFVGRAYRWRSDAQAEAPGTDGDAPEPPPPHLMAQPECRAHNADAKVGTGNAWRHAPPSLEQLSSAGCAMFAALHRPESLHFGG